VSSELDPQKNHYLLDYLGRLPGQAFLTTTDPRLLEAAAGPETAVYHVRGGQFTRPN
ncbi:MAG TPA: DNA replication and repair protein RecF, partial [Anaeromyxobacteraceae bacterium]